MARYIQIREAHPPSTTALLACLTAMDSLLLGGFMGIRALIWPLSVDDQARRAKIRRKRIQFAVGYGALCIVRMWTNMQSTRMTAAFNIQMTALMLPFVTAALAVPILGETIHWALPPTLVASVAGTLMALAGQGAFSSRGSLTWLDVAGIGVQMGSVVCSALVKIALKGSEGVLDKVELMTSQMVATAVPMCSWAVAFDQAGLIRVTTLDAAGVACFFGLAIGIYIIANVTQIMATRRLGAANHSASNPLRLLSACLGSSLLLDETVDSPLGWLGIALIVASLTVYWALQRNGTQSPWNRRKASTRPGTRLPSPDELPMVADTEQATVVADTEDKLEACDMREKRAPGKYARMTTD